VTTLYIVAALLCALAIGILLWPLLRQRRVSGRWSVLGLAVTFAIVPVAFALYVYVSTWDPEGQQRASEHTGCQQWRSAASRSSVTVSDSWSFNILSTRARLPSCELAP